MDDYAFLIAALIELAQVTSTLSYLDKAAELTEVVLKKYIDASGPFFFYTAEGQKDILLRKKEIYDGATPSSNSVMAYNLYRLSILLDKPEWRQHAEESVKATAAIAVKHPTSFGVWLSLLYEMKNGTAEIAIIGDEFSEMAVSIQNVFIPHKLIMAAPVETVGYPFFAGKKIAEKTLIFICEKLRLPTTGKYAE